MLNEVKEEPNYGGLTLFARRKPVRSGNIETFVRFRVFPLMRPLCLSWFLCLMCQLVRVVIPFLPAHIYALTSRSTCSLLCFRENLRFVLCCVDIEHQTCESAHCDGPEMRNCSFVFLPLMSLTECGHNGNFTCTDLLISRAPKKS